MNTTSNFKHFTYFYISNPRPGIALTLQVRQVNHGLIITNTCIIHYNFEQTYSFEQIYKIEELVKSEAYFFPQGPLHHIDKQTSLQSSKFSLSLSLPDYAFSSSSMREDVTQHLIQTMLSLISKTSSTVLDCVFSICWSEAILGVTHFIYISLIHLNFSSQ